LRQDLQSLVNTGAMLHREILFLSQDT